MKIKEILKKSIALLLVFTMILPIFIKEGNEVEAANSYYLLLKTSNSIVGNLKYEPRKSYVDNYYRYKGDSIAADALWISSELTQDTKGKTRAFCIEAGTSCAAIDIDSSGVDWYSRAEYIETSIPPYSGDYEKIKVYITYLEENNIANVNNVQGGIWTILEQLNPGSLISSTINNFNNFYGSLSSAEKKSMADQVKINFYKDNTYDGQAFMTYNYEEKIVSKLSLKKESANEAWVLDEVSDMYSLKDAEYGVYKDKELNSKVGSLVTDKNGNSNSLELEEGRYYIKELKAPKGYILDKRTYTVDLYREDYVLSVKDSPKFDPLSLMLKKKSDMETNLSLEGGEFEVKYYPGIYKNVEGKTPKKTWIFKTNKDGIIKYDDSFLVRGDSLYKDKDGFPIGLIGTYVFKEIKAPEGFLIDKNIYISHLLEDPQSSLLIYKEPIVIDELIYTNIEGIKSDEETSAPIENVEIALYRINGENVEKAKDIFGNEIENVLTDENGYYSFKNLPIGKYRLEEVNTVNGYTKDLFTKDLIVGEENNKKDIIINFTNKPQKMRFILRKEDLVTESIPQGNGTFDGAEFDVIVEEIYQKGSPYKKGDLIDKLIIKDGKAQSKDLPLGVYDVIERKAPDGYDLNPVGIRIMGKADGKGGKYTENVSQLSSNDKALVDLYNGKIDDLNNINRINANGSDEYRTFDHIKVSDLDSIVEDNKEVIFKDISKYGRISLTKHSDGENGEDDSQISGDRDKEKDIIFEIFDEKDILVDTMITDSDGRASSKWLPYGRYRVHQKTKKEGLINVDDFYVDIEGDWKEYQYNLENYADLAFLKIIKIDKETGKEIGQSGVSFEIYDSDNNKIVQKLRYPDSKDISIFETNEEGIVQLPEKLPKGIYYIKEIKGPSGYYLDPNNEPIEVEVSGDGVINAIVIKEVENIPQKGILTIHKKANKLIGFNVNEEGISELNFEEGYLDGSVWELRAKKDIYSYDGKTLIYTKGEVVDELTTNDSGPVSSIELPLGKYELKETSTKESYVLDKNIYDIEFTPQVQEIRIDSIVKNMMNYRKNIDFNFTKIFEESDNFIHERKAKFGLFLNEDYIEGDVLIPKDSLLQIVEIELEKGEEESSLIGSFTNIPIDGSFYIKELETSDDYEISDEIIYKNVDFSDQENETRIESIVEPIINELTRISIKVYKYEMGSDLGIPVSNARYRLVSIDNSLGKKEIGQYLTNEEGIILIDNLEKGKYYLEEVESPEGYIANEETREIILDGEDGDLVEVIVEDEKIPSIKTTLIDYLDREKDLTINEDVKLIDIVEYKDLIVGKEYVLKGKLIRKSDESILDERELKFIPETRDGKIEMAFEINTKELVGDSVVAVEDLYRDGKKLVSHYDLEDENQTIDIPEIKTFASDILGNKKIKENKEIKLVDKVKYKNLIVGKEYRLKGILIDKDTNKPLLINNKEVVSELTFIPESKNGEVELLFIFDGSKLKDKTIVVFEDLYRDNKLVGIHHDINDENQTIRIYEESPSPKTSDYSVNIYLFIFLLSSLVFISLKRRRFN